MYADYAWKTLLVNAWKTLLVMAQKPAIDESVEVQHKPLSDSFLPNTNLVLNDAAVVVDIVYMQTCNDYCLRYVKR
jgi:hypothetical protein